MSNLANWIVAIATLVLAIIGLLAYMSDYLGEDAFTEASTGQRPGQEDASEKASSGSEINALREHCLNFEFVPEETQIVFLAVTSIPMPSTGSEIISPPTQT